MNAIKSALHIRSRSKGAKPPPPPSAEVLAEIKAKFAAAGQEHVFSFYEKLTEAERGWLYEQLCGIDPARLNEISARALNLGGAAPAGRSAPTGPIEPLPPSVLFTIADLSEAERDDAYQAGLDLIGDNKVASVLMAGGQGTRLGSSDPKGCYNIGLASGKSLFQLQAERIRRLQELADKKKGRASPTAVIPWYVMTSGPTRAPTEEFFRARSFFGLQPDNVFFFEQGTLPCISASGKIILQSKSRVAMAPDGNGGLYQALVVSGALQDMHRREIEHVHAYCVDNCLVRVADPLFIGFAAGRGVDIATKVVRKRDAAEPVGVIVQRGEHPAVVEYSEMDESEAEAEDLAAPGTLQFWAANIVNHYYSVRFLDSIPSWVKDLPHHVARKKIPCVDTSSGEAVEPTRPNGIKLEQFVFDVFPFVDLDKFGCIEVKREDEFSPLKNGPTPGPAPGKDDPASSRRDILAQGRRWVEAAQARVESDTAGAGIEVSPLVSYGGEGLEHLGGKTVSAPATLERAIREKDPKEKESKGKERAT